MFSRTGTQTRFWWIGMSVFFSIGIGCALFVFPSVFGTTAPAVPVLLQVTDVPQVIPSEGVEITGQQLILKPFNTTTSTLSPISSQTAVSMARKYVTTGYQATSVLANYTNLGTIRPTGYIGKANIVQNVPVWIVTFTAPAPVNVAVGGYYPSAPAPQVMVTHDNIVLDAYTGKWVEGFFTK